MTRISRRLPRRGAVFLLLAAMILLVIVGATKTLVLGEITDRRAATEQARMKLLSAAIERVRQSGWDASAPIRLPVAETDRQWIEVSSQGSSLHARWWTDDRVVAEATRSSESLSSSSKARAQ